LKHVDQGIPVRPKLYLIQHARRAELHPVRDFIDFVERDGEGLGIGG